MGVTHCHQIYLVLIFRLTQCRCREVKINIILITETKIMTFSIELVSIVAGATQIFNECHGILNSKIYPMLRSVVKLLMTLDSI